MAVATAWSGFQATEWDGEQSLLYGQASTDRFEAEAASTRAGQELTADSAMFTAWLQAHSAGDTVLETEMTRRFTPDYRNAFDAWLALDPFDNPAAPPGPAAMPEYHNAHRAEAERLNAEPAICSTRAPKHARPAASTCARPCCSHPCSSWWPSASDSRHTRPGWRRTASPRWC